MIRLATMTSVCPDWGVSEIIDGMKRHGYAGLEPRVGWGHAAGIELDTTAGNRDAIRSKFEAAGLKICCIATGARFAAEDPRELSKSIDEAHAAIDLAADMGAGVIRTFGGARGKGEVYWMVQRTADAYKRVMDR
ncbi:MAG: TIM barrel protein, partial [bacterium]|nr:TIM barrel protein [bacterium]